MPSDRTPRPVRRASLATLLAGIALIAVYVALSTLDVGKFGQPTDIGGGLLLLVGYALTGVGLLMTVLDLVRHRSDRR